MQFYRLCSTCNGLFLTTQGVTHNCPTCPAHPKTKETTWQTNQGRILYQVGGTYAAKLTVNDDLTFTLKANAIKLALPADTLDYRVAVTADTRLATGDSNASWFTANLDSYGGGMRGVPGSRVSIAALHSVRLLLGQQTGAHAGYGLVHIMYNHPDRLGQGRERSFTFLRDFLRNMTADPSVPSSGNKIIKINKQDNDKYAIHGASTGFRGFCIVTSEYDNCKSINTFYRGNSFTGLNHFSRKVRDWGG
jgi:hypothetical protein